jgi:sugar phosphate isomerase/epimerase
VANCLHIKDYVIERVDTQMGFTVLGAPAGDGALEIPALLNAFSAKPEDSAVVVELWTPYINSVDETVDLEYRWAEKSLEYLRPFFG